MLSVMNMSDIILIVIMLCVIILSAIMLNVMNLSNIILSVIVLCVIMWSVIMPSDINMSAIMLSASCGVSLSRVSLYKVSSI
jgi:hypothetical protein